MICEWAGAVVKRVYIYYTPAGSHIALDMLKAWLKGNNIDCHEQMDLDALAELMRRGCVVIDEELAFFAIPDPNKCEKELEIPSRVDELVAVFVDRNPIPLMLVVKPRGCEELELAAEIMRKFREIERVLS